MSRELFGPMGALLDDADLARAIAAIGACYPGDDIRAVLASPEGGFAHRVTAEHGDVLEFPVRVRALQQYVHDARAWQSTSATPMPWGGLLAQFDEAAPAGTPVRFRVDVADASRDPQVAIDLAWLTRLLPAAALATRGIYVAVPSPPLNLTWDWPLRVGVPRAAWSRAFRRALEEVRYRELFTLVDVDTPGSGCDLLLVPASMRDAMRAALALADVRASAVVVVGGTQETVPQTLAWLDAIRQQFGAGLVALANVPTGERECWFTSLLAEISHNASLDMALFLASRADTRARFRRAAPIDDALPGNLIPPLVFAAREFVDRAVMADLARRIGDAAAALANARASVAFERSFNGLSLPSQPDVTIKDVGSQLRAGADRIAWHHETGDATVLAGFRASVEVAAGAALALPVIALGAVAGDRIRTAPGEMALARDLPVMAPIRLRERTAEAGPPPRVRRMRGPRRQRTPDSHAAPQSPPEPARSVLMQVLTQGTGGAWTPAPGNAVAPGGNCALDTFVGVPRAGVIAGSEPIEEPPPSRGGHELTLVFTPLWRGADGAFPPAQTKRVQLPRTGDSEHAVFFFRAPASPAALRARVVVLFGYRVLQTLVLDAAPEAPHALRLTVENLVAADFGEASEAPRFAAALVVNDNPQGIPGITGIHPDGAVFVEPEGLQKLVDSIRKQLKVLNQAEGAPDLLLDNLDDERVHLMLRNLAALGGEFTRLLKSDPQLAGVLGTAPIQVVDARRGAYLPVEFFYNGKSARPEATRCPNALAALADLAIHDTCPNNKDALFYCPAAFWGFSRCIERQAVGGGGNTIFRQPMPGANTLRPLEKVLLAASQNVRAEDLDDDDGIVKALADAGGGVARAESWTDWQAKVAREQPSLLVLLPHSLDSPDFPDTPALEINGSILASLNLEPELVRTDPARTPLVLLLGCSTALPDVPFLRFVDRFKDHGAVLVIGTIATIRGRQTAAFIKALLAELRAADGTRTFDQVFLRVKQGLLAKGDPFVLSVLAYGDSGWRVRL